MKMAEYTVSFTFTEPILGSQPGKDDPAHVSFINRTKKEHPEVDIPDDEVDALPDISKGTTGFYRDANDRPIIKSYQIKGILKEAASVLNGIHSVKNFRSKVSATVFVSPRDIPIIYSGDITILERPLRAETMRGPRVAIARSEMIPAPASVTFTIRSLDTPKFSLTRSLLCELLDYGCMGGYGQWRSSGIYGQFEYEIVE